MTQLALDIPCAEGYSVHVNPDAHFFKENGQPQRLLWCSDEARITRARTGERHCPYVNERMIGGELRPPIPARFMPDGVCCHDLR